MWEISIQHLEKPLAGTLAKLVLVQSVLMGVLNLKIISSKLILEAAGIQNH